MNTLASVQSQKDVGLPRRLRPGSRSLTGERYPASKRSSPSLVLARLIFGSAVHTAVMTIPDVGRCLGSGEPPREGTEAVDSRVSTGLCVACSGRFEIRHGRLVDHESAPVEDRVGSAEPRVARPWRGFITAAHGEPLSRKSGKRAVSTMRLARSRASGAATTESVRGSIVCPEPRAEDADVAHGARGRDAERATPGFVP